MHVNIIKRISIGLIGVLICTLLTGCDTQRFQLQKEIEDLTKEGIINKQTSTTGISEKTLYDKKGNTLLIDNNYYVLHEGTYYPLYSYLNNYGNEIAEDRVVPSRMEFFTTENEINIPTLFLGQGDKLVYYSTSSLLDYITWERYYDMGYTVGCFNIQTLTNNRCYLDMEEDIPLVPDSELYSILNLNVNQVLLDKIGNVPITADMVDNGILIGGTKSKTYDMEVYAGTYYNHYAATANVHAFKAYELYASIEYNTLQTNIYEIMIPDYFVNGYYKVDGLGMVRIVRENAFTDKTDFNVQLLFPTPDKDDETLYVAPYIYSTFEPLNKYETTIVNTLGYVDEITTESGNQYKDPNKQEKIELKEAIISELEIWCPKEYHSTVTVESPSKETTGDIYIRFDDNNEIIRVNYDHLVGNYTTTFEGGDRKGTLVVTGLFNDYEITLQGCSEYQGSEQDILSKEQETKQEEIEETESTIDAETETEIETEVSTEEVRQRR